MNVTRLETRVERLWREFIEAKHKAMQSEDIRDGIAASRAFGAFMREFEREDGKQPDAKAS